MNQISWAQIPERGSFRLMILGIRIMNYCGYWVGVLAGYFAVLYFFITGKVSRRSSLDYLRRLHLWKPGIFKKRPGLKEAFQHHWNFAITIIDRFWFWQNRIDEFTFTRVGRQHIVAKREKGAILMGAHIGSFDAMRALSLQKDVCINVVMYRSHAIKFNALLGALNPNSHMRVVDLDGGDVSQIFELKERIDRGELVAILGDRPAPYGNPRLIEIPFLGHPAWFPQNPWILASLLECPVLTIVAARSGPKTYHIMVEPLADQVILPRKTREASVRAYMQQYVQRLETICSQHPYQWFNFYDFWNRDKEGLRS